ncbi:hypothetical protein LX78_02935 [Xanthomarina spongicola]|uniref:Uncharacterized protein n=1 Tax=Xanthomarina spongicola TaxID=570520 RepID=A0A316DI28_9FLAO|nr:hypothetical protein LX78_02935 [Xanthomarina spongicola]
MLDLKYQRLNYEDFCLQVGINRKKTTTEMIFDKIVNEKSFKNKSYDSLLKMKLAIKNFNPLNQDLKNNLEKRLQLIQEAIDFDSTNHSTL